MSERRKIGRIEVDVPCTLTLGKRSIPAHVLNLSDEGALLAFARGAGELISNDELGEEASFVLTSFSPHRLYTGEIIRSFFSNDAQHVGLRFWKKFQAV